MDGQAGFDTTQATKYVVQAVGAAGGTVLGSLVVTFGVKSFSRCVRETATPWVERRVRAGLPLVAWMGRRRHACLDRMFAYSAATVGAEFYLLFLPSLFWMGEELLGLNLTMFMAVSLYVGNGLKDLVCAPRPFQLAQSVSAHAFVQGSSSSQEFGFPSTHVINCMGLWGYIVHHLSVRGTIAPEEALYFHAAVFFWVSLIAFGRLYLGMHTLVDVVGGYIVGGLLLGFWCVAGEVYVEEWVMQSSSLPVFQVGGLVLLQCAYPTPTQPTPSGKWVRDFLSVCIGLQIGLYDIPMSSSSRSFGAKGLRVPSSDEVGAALSRFVIGFFLVFATKSIVKEISKAIVSRRSAQQYASVKKTDKRPRPPKYSDNMAVLPMILRGLEYTGIGLAVIYSIAVFHYIGI